MLKDRIRTIRYGDELEHSLNEIESLLEGDFYNISKRALALLVLQEDKEVLEHLKQNHTIDFRRIEESIDNLKSQSGLSLNYIINMRRQEEIKNILDRVISLPIKKAIGFSEKLSRLTMNPITGVPMLILVLYFGLYKFVGDFGAGVVVDFLEEKIFYAQVNPFMIKVFNFLFPWPIISELFVGEYGIITLGVRYAVGIILPIVAIFFFAFSILEDVGYLPRLAMMIDRLFKRIGLSGRAVIPMVLGFGCDTMATMVTRTLPTKRERFIATLLLALAIPCSAQLGVIMTLLGSRPKAFTVWMITITFIFTFIGVLSSKLIPGTRPSFYMEIPPLRLPKLSNILLKTYTRMKWYFIEVFPLFIFASVLIWVGQITGIFNILIKILEFPVRMIGLPNKTAVAFLFGFFRRDYGAGGLYDLNRLGLLSGRQLVVACVTLTLFLPCIAQLLMNIKERGVRIGFGISIFILFFSFFAGFLVNLVLGLFNIRL